jgi:hypothetical protein
MGCLCSQALEFEGAENQGLAAVHLLSYCRLVLRHLNLKLRETGPGTYG